MVAVAVVSYKSNVVFVVAVVVAATYYCCFNLVLAVAVADFVIVVSYPETHTCFNFLLYVSMFALLGLQGSKSSVNKELLRKDDIFIH